MFGRHTELRFLNFPGKLQTALTRLSQSGLLNSFLIEIISQGFPCSDIWHLDVPFVFAQGQADSLGDPNSTKSSLVTK